MEMWGAGVRLKVREECLPVRGSERMTWKYDDDKCRCGLEERGRWIGAVRDLKEGGIRNIKRIPCEK